MNMPIGQLIAIVDGPTAGTWMKINHSTEAPTDAAVKAFVDQWSDGNAYPGVAKKLERVKAAAFAVTTAWGTPANEYTRAAMAAAVENLSKEITS